MNEERLTEILGSNQPIDVFYNAKPIWIQEVIGHTVTIGFMDGSQPKNVLMQDLYEKDLCDKDLYLDKLTKYNMQ